MPYKNRKSHPYKRPRTNSVRYYKGPELKFHDVAVDDASIALGGVIQNSGTVNIIAQGITETTRIGRKVTVRKILWKYTVTLLGGSTVGSTEVIRVILYVDHQTNKATAAAGDLIETDDYDAFRNLGNGARFTILHDKTHALNPHASAGNGSANDSAGFSIFDEVYKTVNIPLEFNAAAGALTEILTNNIGVLLFSKNGAQAGFNSILRLRYSDG